MFFEASKDHPEIYTYLPWGPFNSLLELEQGILDRWIKIDRTRALFAVFDKNLRSVPTLAGVIGFLNTSVEDLWTEIGFVVTLPRYQRTHVTSNAIGEGADVNHFMIESKGRGDRAALAILPRGAGEGWTGVETGSVAGGREQQEVDKRSDEDGIQV
jgi:hypothetical protein